MSEKEKKDAGKAADSFERLDDVQRKLALAYARGLADAGELLSLRSEEKGDAEEDGRI